MGHENLWLLLGVVVAAPILSWGLMALVAHGLRSRLGTRYYGRYQREVRWTRRLGGVQITVGVFWLILLPVYGYSTGYMLVGIAVVAAFALWMVGERWHWLDHFLTRADERREVAAREKRSLRPELFYDANRRSGR